MLQQHEQTVPPVLMPTFKLAVFGVRSIRDLISTCTNFFNRLFEADFLREFGMASFSEDFTSSERTRSIEGDILNRELESAQDD